MQDNHIINWLKSTRIPLAVISRHTKISRKSLSNWKNGKLPTTKSLIKLENYYKTSTSVARERINMKNSKTLDKDYMISLQQQHIETLERNEIQNDVWSCLEHDVIQIIQLERVSWMPPKFTRTIETIGDKKIWEMHLGYNKKELDTHFQEGKTFSLFDHPVHEIITKNSNEYLESIADNFIAMYQLLKNAVGSYHIPFHLSFIAKNGKTVPAVAYCLIEWKTYKVTSKVKFFPTT